MIEEKVELVSDRSVLDQILEVHKLTYKQLAQRLEITDRSLRKFRSGTLNLKLSMTQIKTLSELLQPFNVRIDELPNDWILEKKRKAN
ncbi:MAG: helix-turn-helix domain-containing protein [Waterburya sp.]